MSIFIGIDTSNYTTSVAAVCGDKIYSKRKILSVKHGERGIRQSDAVFLHIKTLPELYNELASNIDTSKISAVGVSTAPRNVNGSYMPVFVSGTSFANVIADTLSVPCISFSHQDGHIMAGIYSSNSSHLLDKPFLSVHLSGGTTEILKCIYNNNRFTEEIIGATSDISAGQFIDRIGVSLGLAFPCGSKIEQLANQTNKIYPLPTSVKGCDISFSGIETKVQRLVGSVDSSELSLGVLVAIAKSLSKALNCAILETNIKDVLLVGGVASNQIIKKHLLNAVDANLYFASPEYSTDNAIGIALLTEKNME